MVELADLRPVAEADIVGDRRRLLKTWQDVDLVRRMDAIIIASRGAYADRNEFLAEALRDRIEAEEERLASSQDVRNAAGNGASDSPPGAYDPDMFGDWLSAEVPTLPRTVGHDDHSFGLHNRDYPTLWGADVLGRFSAAAGGPVPWGAFLDEACRQAWLYAETLKTADLGRSDGMKLAAGFPGNPNKRDSAESRFREHALGLDGKTGPRGPLFLFGLVGVDRSAAEPRIALTDAAVHLLRHLKKAGAGDGPPFGADAWHVFRGHLSVHATAELAMWLRVLECVRDEPDRLMLISRCSWWSGTQADTNSMGYLARGREWGLVEHGLQEGRYRLTELGQHELNDGGRTTDEH